MTRLRYNVIANVSGRLWGAAMNVAFIPVYVHFMGVESFGLVGLFASLTVMLGILDAGLSTVLNRELARASGSPSATLSARHLVRTLEYVYWPTAAVLGVGIAAAAPLVAGRWLRIDHLSIESVTEAVAVMGAVIAFQWPSSLYAGGLLGLQRQVLLNVVTIVIATLRGAGAALMLWLVSPTIQTFFLTQLVVSGLQTFALNVALWHYLGRTGDRPLFKPELLRANGRFAAGVTGIALASILLMQIDKVVLSRLLDLTMFGYYSIAASVGFGLASAASPIFAAVFPKLSELVAKGTAAELTHLYHDSCQLVAIMIVPAAVGVACFAPDLLELWLRDPVTVHQTQLLVAGLTIGTMLNSLVLVPCALQLSHGWTRLLFLKNVIALTLFVPLLIVLTQRWGGIGAAVAWVLLNLGYVVFEVPIMHKRLLRGQLGRWYLTDVALPIVVAAAIIVPGRLVMPPELSLMAKAAWVGSTFSLAFVAVVIALPAGRSWIAQAMAILASHHVEAR